MGVILNVVASIAMPLIKLWVDRMAKTASAKKSFYDFLDAFRAERSSSADLSKSAEDQIAELIKEVNEGKK